MARIPRITRTTWRPLSRTEGFTLIELMVTIAVAAVLLAVAVPSFRHLIISNRLTTAANDVITSVTLARSEAIKRNANVDLGVDGSVKYTDGSGTTTTIQGAPTMPPKVTLNIGQALVATSAGFLRKPAATSGYTGLFADISTTELSSNNHRCIYLATGVGVTSCTDSTACNAAQASTTCKAN